MRYTAALFIGLILVGGASLLIFKPFETPEPETPAAAKEAEARETGSPDDDANRCSEKSVEDDGSEADDEPSGILRESVGLGGFRLAGRVVDKESGDPIERFHCMVQWQGKESVTVELVRDLMIGDAAGRFSFILKEPGGYNIIVRTSRHLEHRLNDLWVEGEEGLTDLCVELDPGLTISGRVLEDATGQPVARALVGLEDRTDPNQILLGRPEATVHTYTDDQGAFTLSGVGPGHKSWKYSFRHRWRKRSGSWCVAALHDSFAQGCADVEFKKREGIEIRLKPGYRVFGRALDDTGKPKEGVKVALAGPGTTIDVLALTRKDGGYRTQPVLPGMFRVTAQPLGDETEEDAGFTGESWEIDLVDRDVELNFGPHPDHVALKGRVIDYTNEPATGVEVLLHDWDRAKKDGKVAKMDRLAVTDENGFFEMKKLMVGRYWTFLEFRHQSRFLWDTLDFKSGGIEEREIRLKGGVIKAVVLDSITGGLYENESCRVYAFRTQNSKRYNCYPKKGRFCLRGLEPGTYNLILKLEDNTSTEREGIVVTEGCVIDDLELVACRGGNLRYRITGFERSVLRRFKTRLRLIDSTGRKRSISQSRGSVNDYGELVRVTALEAGTWEAEFTHREIGSVKRRFFIVPETETEIVVSKADFPRYDGAITLSGRLSFPDDSPAARASLVFIASPSVIGLSDSERTVRGKTDDDGRFSLVGFKPGPWFLRVVLENRTSPVNYDLTIPQAAQSPYPYSLVIATGEVEGRLFNEVTGRRLEPADPGCNVYLRETGSGSVAARQVVRGREGRFHFAGVEQGIYTLSVSSHGYDSYRSVPFLVDGKMPVDFGDIPLSPRGFCIVEVVDMSGNPVDNCYVSFEGSRSGRSRRTTLSTGRYLYYGLPLGSTSLRVKRSGFKPQERPIYLVRGVRHEVRVVLSQG